MLLITVPQLLTAGMSFDEKGTGLMDFASLPFLGMIRDGFLVVIIMIAAYTDLRNRRIPNVLTFPAIASGVIAGSIVGGITGFANSFAGLALAAALLILPVAFGWAGAGDLKLLAAVGAITGPGFVLWTSAWAAIVGGVLAVAVLLARRQFVPVAAGIAVDLYSGLSPEARSGIRLPYAVPIAAGVLISMVLR